MGTKQSNVKFLIQDKAIIESKLLNLREKQLLSYLIFRQGKNPCSYYSLPSMARDLLVGQTTISRCLIKLIALHYVTKKLERHGESFVNEYTVDMERVRADLGKPAPYKTFYRGDHGKFTQKILFPPTDKRLVETDFHQPTYGVSTNPLTVFPPTDARLEKRNTKTNMKTNTKNPNQMRGSDDVDTENSHCLNNPDKTKDAEEHRTPPFPLRAVSLPKPIEMPKDGPGARYLAREICQRYRDCDEKEKFCACLDCEVLPRIVANKNRKSAIESAGPCMGIKEQFSSMIPGTRINTVESVCRSCEKWTQWLPGQMDTCPKIRAYQDSIIDKDAVDRASKVIFDSANAAGKFKPTLEDCKAAARKMLGFKMNEKDLIRAISNLFKERVVSLEQLISNIEQPWYQAEATT